MALASMRDRRIGDYWIRDLGTGHSGAIVYRLDPVNICASQTDTDHEKDSAVSADSPTPPMWDADTADTADTFLNPTRGENETAQQPHHCVICGQPVENGANKIYLPGGVRHDACRTPAQPEVEHGDL